MAVFYRGGRGFDFLFSDQANANFFHILLAQFPLAALTFLPRSQPDPTGSDYGGRKAGSTRGRQHTRLKAGRRKQAAENKQQQAAASRNRSRHRGTATDLCIQGRIENRQAEYQHTGGNHSRAGAETLVPV